MPTYAYRCRKCGAETTLDRLPKDGAVMRHMVAGRICGTFRRDWSTVSFTRVPGGGRG